MTTIQKSMTVLEVNQAYGEVFVKLVGMTALVKSLARSYPGMNTVLDPWIKSAEEIVNKNPSIFVPIPGGSYNEKVLVGIH